MFYTEHPFDWSDWCRDQFGGDFIAELRLVSNQTVKWSKAVRDEIFQHYKQEYSKMMEERINSELIIPFEPHSIMHVFGKEN